MNLRKEADNRIWVSPAELIKNNPAVEIVNVDSYKILEAYFSRDQFDPPQVVWVETYSSAGITLPQLSIRDGHTRTMFAYHHPDIIKREFGTEDIPVRDVTLSVIKNPLIVPENERVPGQEVLTITQYLRTVVAPTREHSKIAPDRIATHLINGWKSMIGEAIAAKFSALAALSLLESPEANASRDLLFKRFLTNQTQIIAGETKEERALLEKALDNMRLIIKDTGLFQQNVARSAFILVSSRSSIIGGEREALQQLYGLLYSSAVEAKLSKLEPGERERTRLQLGETLAEASSRLSGTPDQEKSFRILIQALNDPLLTLDQAIEIYTAENPVAAYDRIKPDTNYEKLKKEYLANQRRPELTAAESVLIDNLGRKMYLDETEISRSIHAVGKAQIAWQQATEYIDKLINQQEELVQSGAKEETINGVLSSLKKKIEALETANSPQIVTIRSQTLAIDLSLASQKVDREVSIHKLGDIINEVFKEDSSITTSSLVRGSIITYLLGEVDDISNQRIVTHQLNQLKSLNPDLRLQVVSGEKTLVVALRDQEQRSTNDNISRTNQTLPQNDDGDKQTSVRPSATNQNITGNRPKADAIITVPLNLQRITSSETVEKRIDEQRVQKSNDKLRGELEILTSLLKTLDLDPTEYDLQTKDTIDKMLRVIGFARFNHLNIVNLIRDYLRRSEEEIKESQ